MNLSRLLEVLGGVTQRNLLKLGAQRPPIEGAQRVLRGDRARQPEAVPQAGVAHRLEHADQVLSVKEDGPSSLIHYNLALCLEQLQLVSEHALVRSGQLECGHELVDVRHRHVLELQKRLGRVLLLGRHRGGDVANVGRPRRVDELAPIAQGPNEDCCEEGVARHDLAHVRQRLLFRVPLHQPLELLPERRN